jgi:hypothetical protein
MPRQSADEKEALRLGAVHEEVYRKQQRSLNPWDGLDDAEQAAWEAWVEHVDATGLTYTKYDPRGNGDDE